jgi:hypothetical protein
MDMLKYARNYGITCNSTKNIPIHPLDKIDSSKPAEFAVRQLGQVAQSPSATVAARRTNAAHSHTHYGVQLHVRAGLNAHVLARTKNSASALKPSLKTVIVLDFSGLKWHF